MRNGMSLAFSLWPAKAFFGVVGMKIFEEKNTQQKECQMARHLALSLPPFFNRDDEK